MCPTQLDESSRKTEAGVAAATQITVRGLTSPEIGQIGSDEINLDSDGIHANTGNAKRRFEHSCFNTSNLGEMLSTCGMKDNRKLLSDAFKVIKQILHFENKKNTTINTPGLFQTRRYFSCTYKGGNTMHDRKLTED